MTSSRSQGPKIQVVQWSWVLTVTTGVDVFSGQSRSGYYFGNTILMDPDTGSFEFHIRPSPMLGQNEHPDLGGAPVGPIGA